MAQYPSVALQQQKRTPMLSPLDAAAQAIGLQANKQQLRLGQQSLEMNAAKLQDLRQAQQDEKDLREAAAAAGGDPDQIQKWLDTRNPRLGETYSKALSERRKSLATETADKLKQVREQNSLLGELSQGITDDASLAAALPQFEKILPGSSQVLGQNFAEAAPRLKQFQDTALEHSKFIDAQQKAAEIAAKALEDKRKNQVDDRKYQMELVKAFHEGVAGTQSQDDLDRTRALLKSLGASPETLNVYPDKWESTIPEQAKTVLGRAIQSRAASIQEYEYAKAQGYKGTFEQWQKEEANRKNAPDTAVSLTPEGLDAAARMFATTGQLPPMGMGAAGAQVRSKIINRAAELNPNLDIAGNKAAFRADEGSLASLTKNRDAVVAFENTASKNLDLFLESAKKIIDTGSPWINQPIRTVSQRGLGNADLIAFNAARQVAINEIAKVTSNPGLSGQLSDSARHEVEAFIPSDATLKQIYKVAEILKKDMKNRHDSLDEKIKEIQGRIGGNVKDRGLVVPGGALEKLLNQGK